MGSDGKKSILLTFDVEDWFQVENFKGCIEFSTWNSFEYRVEKNTLKILDLLDAEKSNPKATFFILGWIARKSPDLIREIHRRGHEVASHGFDHHLCTSLNRNALVDDLKASKELLETLINEPVIGFRAPSFAINDEIVAAVKMAGYRYDSSYNSFSGHGRYGKISLDRYKRRNGALISDSGFHELPVSNLDIGKYVLPLGGGGYFRLYPFWLFRQGMKSILEKDSAFIFYAHPWEFDPAQPRVDQIPRGFKFRHYVNLARTQKKITALIRSFPDCRFITCKEYLKSHVNV